MLGWDNKLLIGLTSWYTLWQGGRTLMARIEIGKYLAADTRVCRGRLIFKGSRILVSDALELTKAGYSPEAIARQYRGIITAKGVKEALTLTRLGIVREIVARTKTAA
jgi:uncharacterized protein (DUF433 family)